MKNLSLPDLYFLWKMKQQIVIAKFVMFAVELLAVETVGPFVNKLLRD